MEIIITKLHKEEVDNHNDIQERIYESILEKTDMMEYYTPVIDRNNIHFENKESKIEFLQNTVFDKARIRLNFKDFNDLFFIKGIIKIMEHMIHKIESRALFNICIYIKSEYDVSNVKIPFDNNMTYVKSGKSHDIINILNEISNIEALDVASI